MEKQTKTETVINLTTEDVSNAIIQHLSDDYKGDIAISYTVEKRKLIGATVTFTQQTP